MSVYCLKSQCCFLCFANDGWLRPACNQDQATFFKDGWYNGKMFIEIISGKWKGKYVGGHWDNGVGAYTWNDCGYMKWDGNRLQSQSGKTEGHHLVYRRSEGKFYFYDDSEYVEVTVTKSGTQYVIPFRNGYATFNDDGWLTTTDKKEAATMFEDGWYDGKMFIKIVSGKWKGKYVGGHWDNGVGAYTWNDCGYMKWDGNRLQSQSGKTEGHHLVYRRSNCKFYFYDNDIYADVTVTKLNPFYLIAFRMGYATFDKDGWLKTTDKKGDATRFSDVFEGGMCVKIESGDYSGKYIGGHWDKGIGAYDFDQCGYMSWDDGHLQSQSGRTSGHHMVFRHSNGYFYFYDCGSSDEYSTGASRCYLDDQFDVNHERMIRNLVAAFDDCRTTDIERLIRQLAVYDHNMFLQTLYTEWEKTLQASGIAVTPTLAAVAADLWTSLKDAVLSKVPNQGNKIDIDLTVIAHGSIAAEDYIPRLQPSGAFFVRSEPQQVTMYEPWGCVINSKMVTRIAAGTAHPLHRRFLEPPSYMDEYMLTGTLPTYWNRFVNGEPSVEIPTTWLWPIDESQPPYNEINWLEIQQHCSTSRFYFRYPLRLPIPLFLFTWLLGLFDQISQLLFNTSLGFRVHLGACLALQNRNDADWVNRNWSPRQYCYEMMEYYMRNHKAIMMTDSRP